MSKEHSNGDNGQGTAGGGTSKQSKIYGVTVSMIIDEEGKGEIDRKEINFGRMDSAALKELTDMFSLMSKDIDQIKRLKVQFEKLEKTKPEYLE